MRVTMNSATYSDFIDSAAAAHVPHAVVSRRLEPMPSGGGDLVREVDLDLAAVSCDGWRLLAKVSHLGTGDTNVVRCDSDVDARAFRTLGPTCGVCGAARDRHHTYIMRHTDGRQVQAGADCMERLFGRAGMRTVECVLGALASIAEGAGTCGSFGRYYGATTVLETAAAAFNLCGWVSAANADRMMTVPTGSMVRAAVAGVPLRGTPLEVVAAVDGKCEQADRDLAQATARAIEAIPKDTGDNYLANVRAAFGGGVVHIEGVAIVASYVAAVARQIDEAALAAKAKAGAFGKPGDRISAKPVSKKDAAAGVEHHAPMTVEVLAARDSETMFGLVTWVKLAAESGHILTWKASEGAPVVRPGDRITIQSASVGDASEFRGVVETRIMRVKLAQ